MANAKKSRKMTLAEENKLRKKMRLEPRLTKGMIREVWKAKAKALPKEKRQQILDMIRERISPETIAEQVGVDCDVVCGVYFLNIYRVELLRKETL